MTSNMCVINVQLLTASNKLLLLEAVLTIILTLVIAGYVIYQGYILITEAEDLLVSCGVVLHCVISNT